MTPPTLEQIEALAATIRKHLTATEEFNAWLAAGGKIKPDYEVHPPLEFVAATRPDNMKIILAGIAMLRPLQERIKELEAQKTTLNPVTLAAGKLLKRKR